MRPAQLKSTYHIVRLFPHPSLILSSSLYAVEELYTYLSAVDYFEAYDVFRISPMKLLCEARTS